MDHVSNQAHSLLSLSYSLRLYEHCCSAPHHVLRSQQVDCDDSMGKYAVTSLKALKPAIFLVYHASEGSLSYCVTSQTWPRNGDLLRDAVK